MENIINFISNIDNSTYNKIRHSKSDAECRRYLKEQLTKQLTLTDVSQQRELLNFRRFMVKGGYGSDEIRSITKESIDDFIKFNCG